MRQFIKILTFSLSLFQTSISIGQIIKSDTVFVKRTVQTETTEIDTIVINGGISPAQPQILIGTTFLPNSNKMIELLNKGLSPESLKLIHECDDSINPKTFRNYPKFNKVKRDSTILTIEVTVVANCCHNFLGEAEVLGADTLNLIYTSYGGFCSCTCCFTIEYKFDTSMEEYYNILNYVKINGSALVEAIPKKE